MQTSVKSLFRVTGLTLCVVGGASFMFDGPSLTEGLAGLGLLVLLVSSFLSHPLTEAHVLADNIKDPLLAGEEIWSRCSSQNSSFKSEQLTQRQEGLIEVTTTLSNSIFHLTFVIAGLLALLIAAGFGILVPGAGKIGALIPGIVGGVFIWVGGSAPWPKRLGAFDPNQGTFWLAREDKTAAPEREFTEIHGVQLLTDLRRPSRVRTMGSRGRGFTGYELNLILKDGGRLNVLAHGDKPGIILEAKGLARALSVPIWHRLE